MTTTFFAVLGTITVFILAAVAAVCSESHRQEAGRHHEHL